MDTAHRRQGIATALIQKLQEIAANRLAEMIFVQADCGDTPAMSLYNKLGTQSEYCTMILRLLSIVKQADKSRDEPLCSAVKGDKP